ncbi:uncharacterized protein F5147DRAFT_783024 [Suillus discolor]|uniref:Uncharacterized protein n=1 Tax=Suillus discolor TaxID=1912936 RepID=A0A9P7JLA2_9AGAM|nr:uncharacterized protein F5147DRAFT_783024 [Suillus discolor]KAG2083122.1 hypothetical protein F5147DRAFT_783024 [Suillus discolor]
MFDRDSLLASEWLENYTHHTDFLPAAEQNKFFKSKLIGTALQWVRVLPLPQQSSLAALIASFKHDFITKPAAERKQCEKKRRKQLQHLEAQLIVPFVRPRPLLFAKLTEELAPPSTPPHSAVLNASTMPMLPAPIPTTSTTLTDVPNQHSPAPMRSTAHTTLAPPPPSLAAPFPHQQSPSPSRTLSTAPTSCYQSPASSVHAQTMPANAGVARMHMEDTKAKGVGEEWEEEDEERDVSVSPHFDNATTSSNNDVARATSPAPILVLPPVARLPPPDSKPAALHQQLALHTTTHSPATTRLHSATTSSASTLTHAPSPPSSMTSTPRPTPPTPCTNTQHMPANAGAARTNTDDAQWQKEREGERTNEMEKEGGRRKNGEGRGGEEEDELQGDGGICEEVSSLIPGLAVEQPSTMQPPSNMTPSAQDD